MTDEHTSEQEARQGVAVDPVAAAQAAERVQSPAKTTGEKAADHSKDWVIGIFKAALGIAEGVLLFIGYTIRFIAKTIWTIIGAVFDTLLFMFKVLFEKIAGVLVFGAVIAGIMWYVNSAFPTWRSDLAGVVAQVAETVGPFAELAGNLSALSGSIATLNAQLAGFQESGMISGDMASALGSIQNPEMATEYSELLSSFGDSSVPNGAIEESLFDDLMNGDSDIQAEAYEALDLLNTPEAQEALNYFNQLQLGQ